MDLRKLKTLIDLVSESNISELEITEAEGKVRIVKEASPLPSSMCRRSPQHPPRWRLLLPRPPRPLRLRRLPRHPPRRPATS